MVAPLPASPAEYLTDPPPVDPDEEIEKLIGARLAAEFVTAEQAGRIRAAILDPAVDAEIVGEDGEPEDPKPWRIPNDSQADWAMALYAKAKAELSRIALERDEHIARAREWYDRRTRDAARDAAFFGPHLEEYAIRRREETGHKVKTVDLPSGRITTTRASAPKPAIANGLALLEWARGALPDVIKTDESVQISAVSPHLAVRDIEIVTEDDEKITVAAVVTAHVSFDGDEIIYGTTPVPGMRIQYPTTTATPKPSEPITTT